MQQMTTRGLAAFLAVLVAVAVAINLYQLLSTGRIQLLVALPAVGLVFLLILLPFMAGWRPFPTAVDKMSVCAACGTLWSPKMEASSRCPACGGLGQPMDA
jgi:membrane protein YdbS with pleckstrin-like domain